MNSEAPPSAPTENDDPALNVVAGAGLALDPAAPPAVSVDGVPAPAASATDEPPRLAEAAPEPAPTQAETEPQPQPLEPAPAAPLARPVEARLFLTALLYILIGSSVAGALWLTLFFGGLPAHVASNGMPRPQRDALLLTVAVAGCLSVLVPGILLLLRRSEQRLRSLERLARLCSPLALSFFLPFFFQWQVFQANELLFVITATLFGFALERAFRLTFSEFNWAYFDGWLGRFRQRRPRLAARMPLALAGLLSLFFCGYFSYFTVLQHLRLQTYSWDMAIFDNIMWNLIRGEWFKASPVLGVSGSHIQFHATFIAYLFGPFYALYQHPETLLVMQSTLAGLAAIPIYLVARRRLGSSIQALVLAYAYVVHAPLHGPLFYDFHFITTAPFWVGWVLYFFETERKRWLIVTWALALLVREEVSASLSAVALFYLLSGKRPRWAVIGGITSVLYFFVVKFGIMPMHNTWQSKQSFAWIFQGLIPPGEGGFNGVIRTIVTNPPFLLASMLDADKLIYFLKTFGPLLLLPMRNRLTWFLFVPAALFTLLSTGYKPLIETYFQYTSNYTPYLFFASAVAVAAIKRQENGRAHAAGTLAALAVMATVFSYNQGAIFQHHNFRGGFQVINFQRSEADKLHYNQLYELIRMIPPRASVMVTEMEAPHLSNRPDCFTMRFGNGDPDYLLANLNEVSWGDSRTHMLKAVNSGKYGFVTSRGRFGLWSKKAGHEKDVEGRKLLGLRPGK